MVVARAQNVNKYLRDFNFIFLYAVLSLVGDRNDFYTNVRNLNSRIDAVPRDDYQEALVISISLSGHPLARAQALKVGR